jgi:hypothetical protein
MIRLVILLLSVLARARAFLPLMAASNADLLSRAAADPSSVVIENPSSNPNSETGAGTGNIVAMDVGLGVFDVRGEVGGDVGPVVERDAEVWAAAQKASEEEDAEEGDEDEDDSSSSSSSSSDDEDEDQGATQPPATGQPKVVPL